MYGRVRPSRVLAVRLTRAAHVPYLRCACVRARACARARVWLCVCACKSMDGPACKPCARAAARGTRVVMPWPLSKLACHIPSCLGASCRVDAAAIQQACPPPSTPPSLLPTHARTHPNLPPALLCPAAGKDITAASKKQKAGSGSYFPLAACQVGRRAHHQRRWWVDGALPPCQWAMATAGAKARHHACVYAMVARTHMRACVRGSVLKTTIRHGQLARRLLRHPQKFDASGFENGVFLGPVASLTFKGPFLVTGVSRVSAPVLNGAPIGRGCLALCARQRGAGGAPAASGHARCLQRLPQRLLPPPSPACGARPRLAQSSPCAGRARAPWLIVAALAAHVLIGG